MDAPKPWPMDVSKPYKFIWFGDARGPKPHKFKGFRWAFISKTPVMFNIIYLPNGNQAYTDRHLFPGKEQLATRGLGRNTVTGDD